MLVAGVILLATKHSIGWLFICICAALAYSLYNKNKSLMHELSKIDDFDSFCDAYDAWEEARAELAK